jgi:hypothetical protein
MNRFGELIIQLEENYPDDWWLKAFNSEGAQDELFTRKFDIYRSSLSELDSKSWEILKSKLLLAFKQSIPKRGKTSFFNLFNESLAYQYLKKSGFDNVRLIKESNVKKVKTPDLSFQSNENKQYCEVKTINVSDKQLNLYDDSVQISSFDYTKLTDQFFKKLESTIESACSKFQPLSKKNIVYIIVQLDDFPGLYTQNCINSITRFLKSNFEKQTIFLRFGTLEYASINHNGY